MRFQLHTLCAYGSILQLETTDDYQIKSANSTLKDELAKGPNGPMPFPTTSQLTRSRLKFLIP